MALIYLTKIKKKEGENIVLMDNQKIEITWNNANKKHYISKGYNFTKNGDKFVINVKDLSKGSNHKVEVICDNCGTAKTMNYSDYIKCHNKHNIDLCSHCRNLSAKMTWEEKYGVSHPKQVQEIKDKGVATCIEKYGCANPMQNQDIRQKAENTLFERYGVKHPLQNEEIHKKANDVCIEKYGVACVFKSDEIKEKIRQTLYSNGTCPTSSQQLKIYHMLKDIYGNCELNYPCSQLSLDCFVNVDGVLIDCEYDGRHWHQDYHKDLRRDKVVKKYEYKVLRIKGVSSVPTKEQLQNAIKYLVGTNHNHYIIELDI